ncbi:hypothetical protein [Solidesulfovibrio carbinolicus]|uniref:Uncharacterized protein n=1 Tax=Solidesulfovibrio carbinolicus TaxID=296842 RepID=A0A4V0YRF4_9BACT|nr:hypothetical protein [Solidesulfovibrio carbinolicus]QAZ69612.1 hypothetical protein C3Y92_20285 [Solidesulfovibrio carbinolicus]
MRATRQAFFLLGLLVVGLVFLTASGPGWHEAWCLLVLPGRSAPTAKTRLLACSNIEQDFEAFDAVDTPASENGWSVLSPRGDKAVVRVRLRKSTEGAVFYPRLRGPGAVIAVNEAMGDMRRELFRMSRTDAGWTAIGEQQSLCLRCVENGWSDEEFEVTVEIELQGQGAQLWHKDNIVFF